MFRGMPNMFIDNSPSYAEADYTVSIISALSKIALGDHGFEAAFPVNSRSMSSLLPEMRRKRIHWLNQLSRRLVNLVIAS